VLLMSENIKGVNTMGERGKVYNKIYTDLEWQDINQENKKP
jgi:hypothetical protein